MAKWIAVDRGVGWEVHKVMDTQPMYDGEPCPCWCGTSLCAGSVNDGFRDTMERDDAEFIARACNAYVPVSEATGE